MVAAAKKSKKLSDASASAKPPDEPILFLDRSLGKKQIASALRAEGADVRVHDDHFPSNAKDEYWLTEVGQKGWIVLTKDDQIRHHPVERDALMAAGVGAFILPRGNTTGSEMARAFVKALPKIKKFIRKHSRPFIARVTSGGSITMLDAGGRRP